MHHVFTASTPLGVPCAYFYAHATETDDLSSGILDFDLPRFSCTTFAFHTLPYRCYYKMGNLDLAHSTKSAEAVSHPPPYSSISEITNEPPNYRQSESSRTLSGDRCIESEGPVAIDECITHLKFLSATAKLRNFVRETDKLFGIHDSEAQNFSDPHKQAQAAVRIQEKRWAVYVTRAVDRFTTWWQTCLPSSNDNRISMWNHSSEARIAWTAHMMPPLG